jgi:RHS repeat-associated protein
MLYSTWRFIRSPQRRQFLRFNVAAILQEDYTYTYDEMGNLSRKEGNGKRWEYRWHVNGMLHEVKRPDGKLVRFTYDALGRRLSKEYDGTVTRWVWDGNLPLHEWEEDLASASVGDNGDFQLGLPSDPVTWLFDEGSFSPAAKLVGDQSFSIVSDYLGKPEQMYDSSGELTWDAEYDIYGNIRKLRRGSLNDCPFRFPGQYSDEEVGLYYNRFRYYDPGIGGYVSQDPIGLRGGIQQFHFTHDSNAWSDIFGLATCHGTTNKGGLQHFSGTDKPLTQGATPNSVYSHVKDGKVVQNAIYDGDGKVIGHVDFKNHGIESGHFHRFPDAGNPASGHGPGKPHFPNSGVPDGWGQIPEGFIPNTPIGT